MSLSGPRSDSAWFRPIRAAWFRRDHGLVTPSLVLRRLVKQARRFSVRPRVAVMEAMRRVSWQA